MKKLDILTERVGVYGKKERKYWKGNGFLIKSKIVNMYML